MIWQNQHMTLLQALRKCPGRWPAALLIAVLSLPLAASHAFSQFGDIKYPPGFHHFEWVNPDAPKGGELALIPSWRVAYFDKYNPFTLKGTSAPGIGLVFDTLLTGTMDEPTTAYGLLAEDVTVAPDRLSATFRLNPAARFHDGKPVLAADVKYSFDTLNSSMAHPAYRQAFADVKGAVVLGERLIRFDFKTPSLELPIVVGTFSVFSPAWGKGKPFDKVVNDIPIGSGPYRIGPVRFGKDITYVRDPNYWARDLNVRRGIYNFDRVTYRMYKDDTAKTEAFKAGEFDYIQVGTARAWARTYVGKKFDSGELVRREVPTHNAGTFAAWYLNTRRPKFADPRVRRAIALAQDFEWMNRRLFYSSYRRTQSWFPTSDFEAKGLPGSDELAVLEPLRGLLKPEIFTQTVPEFPSTDPPNSLRNNLRQARELLAAAGWRYRDGALRNAQGEPFTLEFLDSQGDLERIMTPYLQALSKLGIQATFRVVDFALLERRFASYDFDAASLNIPGSEAPGADLRSRLTSTAAETEEAYNFAGIRDPAVDRMVELVIAAKTRPDLVARLRALDRVLRHGYYVVPNWHSNTFRIAYRGGKFEQPKVLPLYYQPEDWVVSTWWASHP
jgi:microcin C transport system substrate-binding protein